MASRGKPKPKLRDLSRQELTDEQWNAAYEAFLRGTPIVTAMLGQAMVEYEVDRLLKSRFKYVSDETWAALTDDRGPLSTFSQKITMVRAFGLITETTEDHLGRIRRVRNAFAHAKHLVDFEDPLVLSEIRGAKLPPKPHSKLYQRIKWARDPNLTGSDSYRLLCQATFSELIRRSTRGLIAANRNKKRKRDRIVRARNPFANALARPPSGYGGGLLQGALQSHIADPSQTVQPQNALARYLAPEPLDDSEGK